MYQPSRRGSSHEALVSSQALFDSLWRSDSLVPMVIVSANTTPLSFYFDDPESGGAQWETFIAEELPNWVRANYKVRSDRDGTVMTWASMGGYGTLKIAFRHPDQFCAIAVLEPAIEPGVTRADSPLRSRLYSAHADPSSARLIGPKADVSFYDSNAPSTRLLNNADDVRASGMKIYLECGDQDALNLQDGTEYLHRLLWDLDISHEYHLVKDADHVGPSIDPRLVEAFTFLSDALQQDVGQNMEGTLSDAGRAWMAWTQGGMQGDALAFNLNSEEGVAVLRALFAAARTEIEKSDPTVNRRYAKMPPTVSQD